MDPDSQSTSLQQARQLLLNWFTPERADILQSDGQKFSAFLGLGTPPDAQDATAFYRDRLKKMKAQSKEALSDSLTRLDQNLVQLCRVLHLGKIEHRILHYLCLAEVHSELRALTEMLEHTSGRQAATQIAECLGIRPAVVFLQLNQTGKLVQSGLVHKHRFFFNGSMNGVSFRMVDPELAFHLVEESFDLKRITTSLGSKGKPPQLRLEDFKHIQPNLDLLIPYLKTSLEKKRKGVNIFIHGVPGTGKSELGRLLGATLGCGTFEPSFFDEDGDPISGEMRFSKLRSVLSFLGNDPPLIVCDEAEDFFQNIHPAFERPYSPKLWTNRLLEENQVPVIWLSNSIDNLDPAVIRRFDFIFELPVPSRLQRGEIIAKAVGDCISRPLINHLATHENLAPAVVTRAADVLGQLGPDLPAPHREQAFNLLVSQTLKAQGHRVSPAPQGPAPLPYDPRHSHASVDLDQLLQGLRTHPQARICLEGPPGTGKTAFGKWLADQLDLSLHSRRLSDLLSQYVGQTEKAMAAAFEEASREGGLLLLDEIDSLLADRGQAIRSWEVSHVNEMLTQLECFQGILIATTNRFASLDAASRRRFDLTITLDYLKQDQVIRLCQQSCATLQLSGKLSLKTIGNITNATPGDFAALCREHCFHPFTNASDLAQSLLSRCSQKKDSAPQPLIGFRAS